MHIVLCLDERNGMLFNKRRVSSDRAVCQRMIENASGQLWMNGYSAKLFTQEQICVAEDYLDKAAETDTCFVESLDFMSRLNRIKTITVYRWNRHYPSDVKLSADLLADWTLTASTEFPGSSHETVTEEKYER